MPVDEDSRLASDLARAVELLAAAFAAKSVRYALIGGLATLARGRPRFTQDVDMLVDVPQIVLPPLLEELRDAGFEFDMMTVIRQYRDEHLTVLRFGSVRIDWLKERRPHRMGIVQNDVARIDHLPLANCTG